LLLDCCFIALKMEYGHPSGSLFTRLHVITFQNIVSTLRHIFLSLFMRVPG
jgi:hypothetical protein